MHHSFENWLRRNAYFLVSLREGYPDVLKYRKEFLKFTLSSYDQMRNQSFDKLRNIVRHAYDTTSYYRTVMEKVGLHPEDIKEPKDLCHLPFVDKNVIEMNKEAMISNRFPKHRLEKSYTGGTGGTHIPNPAERLGKRSGQNSYQNYTDRGGGGDSQLHWPG